MLVLYDINDYRLGPPVLVMGKFDGLHLGHAMLIDEAVRLARERGAVSVALTFDRHPLSVLAPDRAPGALTTAEEKRALIAARGVDALIVSAFTEALAGREAGDYLAELCAKLRPLAIVCGPSCRFGRGALGDAALIRRMAGALGYQAVILEPLTQGGEVVSSSAIRAALQSGDIRGAERMLGRPLLEPVKLIEDGDAQ